MKMTPKVARSRSDAEKVMNRGQETLRLGNDKVERSYEKVTWLQVFPPICYEGLVESEPAPFIFG